MKGIPYLPITNVSHTARLKELLQKSKNDFTDYCIEKEYNIKGYKRKIGKQAMMSCFSIWRIDEIWKKSTSRYNLINTKILTK